MNPIRTMLLLALLLIIARPARADEESVRSDSYEIAVSTTRPATVDQPAEISVVLVAVGPYKVNQEFPISLRVTGPGDVDLPSAKLQKADADVSEKRAEFRVTVTPRATGDKGLTFALRFAVCTAKRCAPAKETITFRLRVI